MGGKRAIATPPPTDTPTATSTRQSIEICYDFDPRQAVIYRIDASLFRGYVGDVATENHLIEVTSPPAPAGWNQPDLVPDASWRPAAAVWWEGWRDRGWGPLISGASILGLTDGQGNPEMVDGVTHLIRQTFHFVPPAPGMRILSVSLEMWSDNKSAWWWGGERVMVDREGYGGLLVLAAEQFDPEGGTYVLAVQNSNDFHAALNPQGTAFRLCVVWAYPNSP